MHQPSRRGGGALALLLCVMNRRGGPLGLAQGHRPPFPPAFATTSGSPGSHRGHHSQQQQTQQTQQTQQQSSSPATRLVRAGSGRLLLCTAATTSSSSLPSPPSPPAASSASVPSLSFSSSASASSGGGWGGGAAIRRHWPFTGGVVVGDALSAATGTSSKGVQGGRRGAALAAAAAATTATLLTTAGGGGSSEMQQGQQSHADDAPTGTGGDGKKGQAPYKVVFVLGGPGAGKGTQCEKLVQRYGFVHLSAGELLRQERAKGTEDGKLIDEYLVQGKIVPVRISLGLLRREMAAWGGARRFLVDGFPRNFDNVEGWEEVMGGPGGGIAEVEAVLALDCPEEVLIERLLKRGETSGRTDDNVESARKRFRTYNEATRPVIEYYEAQANKSSGGLRVARIPAQHTVAEVFGRIQAAVDPLIAREVLGLTHALLDAIAKGDWATYEELCAKDMTCFEPEARGHLVEGLEFHKFYFDNGNALGKKHASTISQPHVRVLGRCAVVTYVRVVQTTDPATGQVSSSASEETRVWAMQEEAGGRWQCVHFHRSPAPSGP